MAKKTHRVKRSQVTSENRTAERPDPRRLRLGLLGGFSLVVDGEPIAVPLPAQRLLALLALEQGRPVSRSRLAGMLWPESSETAARSNLRSALFSLGPLRRILVEIRPDSLCLSPQVSVDLLRRRTRAHRMLNGTDNHEAAYPSKFTSDLLPHWDDMWLEPERESYRNLRLHVLEKVSERLVRAGSFADAVEVGLLAVAAAPLRESAHRALIRALASEGNRGEALSRFNDLRELLGRELGLEPSFQLEDVLAERTDD